MSFENILL